MCEIKSAQSSGGHKMRRHKSKDNNWEWPHTILSVPGLRYETIIEWEVLTCLKKLANGIFLYRGGRMENWVVVL